MTRTRTLTIGGLIAVLLITSACHRHWRHHHRHHSDAGVTQPADMTGPAMHNLG